jgi:hypothetical protein
VAVGDFSTPLSPKDKLFRQKINREILELNDTVDQMDLTGSYSVFYPATAQYAFFSAIPGTFSKIDHILGQKVSLNKYKTIEITPSILSDHKEIKLEVNRKRRNRKYPNNWRLTTDFSMISGSQKK